jgi:hypothetical protein
LPERIEPALGLRRRRRIGAQIAHPSHLRLRLGGGGNRGEEGEDEKNDRHRMT